MWQEKIKILAKKKGMTIKELSIAIEMSEANLYKCFKKNTIQLKYLERIAQVLGVSPAIFLDENPDETSYKIDKIKAPVKEPEENYKEKYIKEIEEKNQIFRDDIVKLKKQIADLTLQLQSQKQTN